MRGLEAAWPDLSCRAVTFKTRGDVELGKPLPSIGGKGLFTAELEAALVAGEIDVAVHSLKDLPVDAVPGLAIGAIAEREDPRDALVARDKLTLNELPRGAVVGTGSPRRRAQLTQLRPDLRQLDVRGNVETRIGLVDGGTVDAVLLAAAGLERLGLTGRISQLLGTHEMLPAPGQGALALQCRADDAETRELVEKLHDEPSAACTGAERAFLAALGGGCAMPIAAHCSADGGKLRLSGLVASPDGARCVRLDAEGVATEPLSLGERLAERALALGAGELLRDG